MGSPLKSAGRQGSWRGRRGDGSRVGVGMVGGGEGGRKERRGSARVGLDADEGVLLLLLLLLPLADYPTSGGMSGRKGSTKQKRG